jgi:hypothetical protein
MGAAMKSFLIVELLEESKDEEIEELLKILREGWAARIVVGITYY